MASGLWVGTSLIRPFVEAGKAGGLEWRCCIRVVDIWLYGEKKSVVRATF